MGWTAIVTDLFVRSCSGEEAERSRVAEVLRISMWSSSSKLITAGDGLMLIALEHSSHVHQSNGSWAVPTLLGSRY